MHAFATAAFAGNTQQQEQQQQSSQQQAQQALESDPAFESFHERLASDQGQLRDRQRALGRVKLKKRRLPASRQGNFGQQLDCMRPWQQAKSPFYNDELLTQPLERGRVCAVHTCQMGPRGFCLLIGSATCSQFSCGLNVRDGVATAAEALSMVEHGRRVLKQVVPDRCPIIDDS